MITTYKTFPRPLQVKYGILLNQDESLDQFVPYNLNIEKKWKIQTIELMHAHKVVIASLLANY